MERRRFIELLAASPLILSSACDEARKQKPSGGADRPRLLGRDRLIELDGLTSIHEHLDGRAGADGLLQAMDRAGIARTNLLGIFNSIAHGQRKPDWDSAYENNELLLDLVKVHPDRFTAFVLFNGTESDLVPRLIDYLGQGARGVKLYNGARSHRRCALDSPKLQSMYRFCELHGVPVLAHVDPPYRYEYLQMVRSYPALPWIFPHLFILTKPKELEHFDRVLNRFPNLSTDFCFGFPGWMHGALVQLAENRDRLREVFIRHADQIMFGTDIVYLANRPNRGADWATNSFKEYRKFLEFDRFHHRVQSGKRVYEAELEALALPDEVLRKIYVDNARRFLDRRPVRTERDDLDKVLVSLPEGAVLDQTGDHALLTVAAVGALSHVQRFEHGAADGPATIATLTPLASGVADALGMDAASIRGFDDAVALRDFLAADTTAAGVLPFDDLDPRLKTLEIGGLDPSLPALTRCSEAGEATQEAYFEGYPLLLSAKTQGRVSDEHRFDPHEIRTLLFTGSSLLGQGMTQTSLKPPVETTRALASLFQQADVSHVSVENPHLTGCNQEEGKFRFCYVPERLEELDHLGIDVIEVTGNHVRDHGSKQLLYTLNRYQMYAYPTFGGGRNLDEALTPAVVDVRGLKFGFIGLNRQNRSTYGATNKQPGPMTLRDDHLEQALARAKKASDLFFFSYQGGTEFSVEPYPGIVNRFHQVVDAGAVGTVGTHAHMPVGAEVYRNAFLAYGLGNFLFRHPKSVMPFDPMTERGVVLRRVFYRKKPLGVGLIPFRNDDGVLHLLEGSEAWEVIDRMAKGSRPGLGSRRAVAALTDAFIELDTVKDATRALTRVQTWTGLCGQLLSLSTKAADKFKSSDEALELLKEVSRTPGLVGTRIALPIRPGWSLPADDGYHAVRVWLRDTGKRSIEMTRTAAAAGLPVHIVAGRRLKAEQLSQLIDIARGRKVIVSGLAGFRQEREVIADLLLRYRELYFDIAGSNMRDLVDWFRDLQQNPDEWSAWIRKHHRRLLLGTGAWNARNRYHWHSHIKLLTTIRCIFEDRSFRMQTLPGGEWDEWRYDFSKDTTARGLGLETNVVDDILFGNFERIFPTD